MDWPTLGRFSPQLALMSEAVPPSPPSSIDVAEEWLHSIDSVYALFEDAQLRRQYGHLAHKVEDAVRLCEGVIRELGLEHCALSFNGGKDCTVIVHILAAVLRRLNQPGTSSSSPLVPIPSVYITCPSPFPVLESFIRASQVRYNLDLHTVPGGMKDGLLEYFDGGGEPGVPDVRHADGSEERARTIPGRSKRSVKAIFIGTRRTDPGGESLAPRKWTDPSWPPVERIHPILDWSYADVWAFLRCPALGERVARGQDVANTGSTPKLSTSDQHGTTGGGKEGVPYCVLYDQGFTSLGSTFNTFPNPLLARDGNGTHDFNPAWQLQDASSERAGRGDKQKQAVE